MYPLPIKWVGAYIVTAEGAYELIEQYSTTGIIPYTKG